MWLVSLLGNWTDGAGPLHRRLARRLEALVADGALAPGERLPPERALAAALAVSRTTVVGALDELRSAGLVASRRGSGTLVVGATAPGRRRPPPPSTAVALGRRRAGAGGDETIDLATAALPALSMIAEELRVLAAGDLEDLTRRVGYEPLGLGELRRRIAALLGADGVPSRPEQILVTTGAQQAFALACALYVRPRDRVAVEDPGHPGLVDVLRAAGADLVPVPVDAHGMDVDALEAALGAQPARLCIVTPTGHNPTGIVMPAARRSALARLARRRALTIVEDNALLDVVLDGKPPPPIAAADPRAPVLLVGSMSKLFWPGLRVGWVRAASPIVDQLARLKAASDLGTPLLSQALAARLLARRDEARAIRRREFLERRDALAAALTELLPELRWRRPSAGFSFWVRLPAPRAEELSALALRHGVTVAPGRLFSPAGTADDRLRLTFVAAPERIAEGVRRLAAAWAEIRSSARRTRSS